MERYDRMAHARKFNAVGAPGRGKASRSYPASSADLAEQMQSFFGRSGGSRRSAQPSGRWQGLGARSGSAPQRSENRL